MGTNDGTLIAGAAIEAGGITGDAVDFDANGQGVAFAPLLGPTGTADYSISVWVRFDGTFSTHVRHEPAVDAGALFRLYTEKSAPANTGYVTVQGIQYSVPWSFTDQSWHHFVAVREATGVRVYVDNVPVVTDNIAPVNLNETGTHYLGRDPVNNRTFPGQIDDLQVYDYALSTEEVDLLFTVPGATSVDTDGDGILDATDNCPGHAGADQTDTDGDGFGDLCAHPSATIDPSVSHFSYYVGPKATIGANTSLGTGTIVGRRADIGANVALGANNTVARAVVVGSGTTSGDGTTIGYGSVIGNGVGLGSGVVVSNLASIGDGAQVGDNVAIGRNSSLVAAPVIGDDVRVGPGTTIHGGISPTPTLGDAARVRRGSSVLANAQVGAGAVIGRDVTVCASRTVGTGAIVRAGNTITADVPAAANVDRAAQTAPCP